MLMAMKGAIGIITSGNSSATHSTGALTRRVTFSAGDDSNTIGNSAQDARLHSESIFRPNATATGAGRTSSVQNATAVMRRSDVGGNSTSFNVAALGRMSASTSNTGNATYARLAPR